MISAFKLLDVIYAVRHVGTFSRLSLRVHEDIWKFAPAVTQELIFYLVLSRRIGRSAEVGTLGNERCLRVSGKYC
jgi:hypothetical protein